jgi:hypothetical protein
MRIGKQTYTRAEALRRVGNISQIGGTRHYTLAEGRSQGVSAIDVETGGGLRFTIVPDRSLDISAASYKGTNLVYRTPNGEVHPSFYEPQGGGWLRTFFGGLLTTCGLTYLGAPGRDGDQDLGLHGRQSTTPAFRVCDLSRWQGDEYIIEVSGVMEDAVLFGDKLRLTRTISTHIGAKSLTIHDAVQNIGFRPSPFTILYHINPGFPLLDAGARVVVSALESTPYDEASAQGMGQMLDISAPVAGWKEHNFLHRVGSDGDGKAHAALINPHLAGGLGLAISFDAHALPYLSQWKMMGEGDYVIALEPCNAPCQNRAGLRKKNLLPFLAAGETRDMQVEFAVLEGTQEIEQFEAQVSAVIGRSRS